MTRNNNLGNGSEVNDDNIQIEDVQSNETANNNDDIASEQSVVSQHENKTDGEEIKKLKICKLFVTWPKTCFGK